MIPRKTLAQQVRERIDGTVNVRDFGAKGDGVTDDTAAFQAAFNSRARTVYVPPGTYCISGGPGWPVHIGLQGAGRGKTRIMLPDRDTS
jgi:hypothetical protein